MLPRSPVLRSLITPVAALAMLVATLLPNFHSGTTAVAADAGSSKVKVVEVSVAGTDVESAETDACREAVRQVVGSYVNAVTRARRLTCQPMLNDGDGDDIAVDAGNIETLGVGGMQYWEEPELPLPGGPRTIAIAPTAISRRDVDRVVPTFTCKRVFRLHDNEVHNLETVLHLTGLIAVQLEQRQAALYLHGRRET